MALIAAVLSTEPKVSAPQYDGGAAPGFGVGERLTYAVKYGKLVPFPVGSASMAINGRDTVAGHVVWRAVLQIHGSVGIWPLRYELDDSLTSWFDSSTFVSRQFRQRLREPKYHADKLFAIDPERQTYKRDTLPAQPSVLDPLDDISFLYYVRTLPLAPDQVYRLPRYFRPDGNPVTIRVIRRERVHLDAGDFAAVVIQPEIKTSGIFSDKGHAQLWLSDDSSRVLLQLESGLPFGSINLYLTQIIPAKKP